MLKKLFRPGKLVHWQVQEKEVIDEIIFRTTKVRNRLMLELMARGGMRVGEVLKLTGGDVEDQKLIIRNPKSGKSCRGGLHSQEAGRPVKGLPQGQRRCRGPENIPHHLYCRQGHGQKGRCHGGGHLRPHDLRRHAATYASRSGVPVEIVSKVILRHANLSTTQRYLGKVSDVEAVRWIENLYG